MCVCVYFFFVCVCLCVPRPILFVPHFFPLASPVFASSFLLPDSPHLPQGNSCDDLRVRYHNSRFFGKFRDDALGSYVTWRNTVTRLIYTFKICPRKCMAPEAFLGILCLRSSDSRLTLPSFLDFRKLPCAAGHWSVFPALARHLALRTRCHVGSTPGLVFPGPGDAPFKGPSHYPHTRHRASGQGRNISYCHVISRTHFNWIVG